MPAGRAAGSFFGEERGYVPQKNKKALYKRGGLRYNGRKKGEDTALIFESFDRKQIFVREWTDVKEPVGVVQIAHGMNEYAARYDKFARALNAMGYAVVADDHRGHGDTDAETLGYAEGDMFADTVKDMAGIARFYGEKYKGLKYVLFGFSYGSFLTQAFLEKYARFLDGAIVAGSARQSGAAVRAGRFVSGVCGACKGEDAPADFVNRLVFGGYDKKFGDGDWQWLSSDRENNEKYRADPFCNFVCSNAFFRSFFRGMAGLYKKKNAAGLDRSLPLLLIAGKDDPVGGEKGMTRLYEFYRKQGIKDVSLRLIEGSRHEFLNEREHFDEAFAAIADFIKRIPVRKR